MKINKLTIILSCIIIILIGYIIFLHLNNKEVNDNKEIENVNEIIEVINLEYLNIYLTKEGVSYLAPKNLDEISKLNINKTISKNLKTLYNRAFIYEIYINGKNLKGFKIKLDDKIIKMKNIDNNYIAFIKENHTIGLFNYENYYTKLVTSAIDNYNDYQNVLDIKNQKIIYLDNNEENIKLEK